MRDILDQLRHFADGGTVENPRAMLREAIAEMNQLRARETRLRAECQRERDLYAKTVDECVAYRLDYNGPATARDAIDRLLTFFDAEVQP